jgi:hypothetical protein
MKRRDILKGMRWQVRLGEPRGRFWLRVRKEAQRKARS